MCEMPNKNTENAIIILNNRFAYFKDRALSDANYNYLMINKAKQQIENLQGAELDAKKIINDQLEELRKQIMIKKNQDPQY